MLSNAVFYFRKKMHSNANVVILIMVFHMMRLKKMRMKMMMVMIRRIHIVFFLVKHRGSTPRRRSYKTQGEDDEESLV